MSSLVQVLLSPGVSHLRSFLASLNLREEIGLVIANNPFEFLEAMQNRKIDIIIAMPGNALDYVVIEAIKVRRELRAFSSKVVGLIEDEKSIDNIFRNVSSAFELEPFDQILISTSALRKLPSLVREASKRTILSAEVCAAIDHRRLRDLEFALEVDFLPFMQRLYRETARTFLYDLEKVGFLVRELDLVSARKLSHRLKGNAGNEAMRFVFQSLQRLEFLIYEQNIEESARMLEVIKIEYLLASSQLNAFLNFRTMAEAA